MGHLRVIKLGGSLLDLDGLTERFRRWLAAQPPMTSVTVVGGGRLADVVRDAFARRELDEEAAHWLCIRLLGVTAELVHRLLPESVRTACCDALRAETNAGRLVVFEPETFLRREEPRLDPPPLPHSWDVTSDSIAARLAERLSAEELVLLKSRLPQGRRTLAGAAESGCVDRFFPQAAVQLAKVRAVCLRDEGFAEVVLEE